MASKKATLKLSKGKKLKAVKPLDSIEVLTLVHEGATRTK